MSSGSAAQSVLKMSAMVNGEGRQLGKERCSYFQMPLHYPRYTKTDYETMPEWKLNRLLVEYGLPVTGDVEYKRKFAMGAFLWPAI
ncbi:hypothetical protein J5N97_022681 [Dioscorea zingiberensis]|uniref:DUF7722 domain-containing protein n=1 Tax=Dioscorea zingiberensis TaxID=325984 RepID=A0A9D5CBD9_9LILI|nr:hypothetical protein J5N97_022681 [Dioscorea zingiberensis]